MKALVTDENRPYIEFERVKNKNITSRPGREAEVVGGVVVKKSKPPLIGETKEVWRKSLVSRLDSSPYSWVGVDWVMARIASGCTPIGVGNLDKLPANYPAEWMAQLNSCIDPIRGHVESNRRVREMEAELARREAEMAEKLAKMEADAKPAEIEAAPAVENKSRRANARQAEGEVEKHA